MKAVLFIPVLLVAIPGLAAKGDAAEPLDCASAARETVHLAKVADRLDILLEDGRRIYFPTLEPPRATAAEPDRAGNVAREVTSLLAGKPLVLQKLADPDRWGRIPSRLTVEGESESVDEALAAAGLAMASAEADACNAGLRLAEAAARADRIGIWADPDFAALSGQEKRDLSARAGALTLVEGRVSSIGHTAPRLYLNLGGGRGSLSLTIARGNLSRFEQAGLSEKNLLHKRIRARGVLEIGAGPRIELFRPKQIELIEDSH
jgi:endonuclease YncB( thermonuclease family)